MTYCFLQKLGTTALYSRAGCFDKRRIFVFLCLWLAASCLAGAQTLHKVVISHASAIALGSVGVHTHANSLLFDTGSLDVLKMSQDPVHFPRLKLRAFSSLPTNRAALPPDLAAFSSPSDPPLPNPYGAISGGAGKPGWTVLPVHQNGKNGVRVLVPSRFANWLALQAPARRRLYGQPARFTLQITWG